MDVNELKAWICLTEQGREEHTGWLGKISPEERKEQQKKRERDERDIEEEHRGH